MNQAQHRLAGRRIVVTGAASGMGEGIARLFAAEGARLVLLDVDATRLGAVSAETDSTPRVCDIASEAEVDAAIAFAAETLGGIDGLVNVAGVLVHKTVAETTWADFQKVVGVNLAGPFLTCRAALPHLHDAPAATIVNVSSLSGLRSVPTMAVYSATKAGLIAFGEALSGELGPNVRLNTICPGIIRTPMTEWMFAPGTAGEDNVRKSIRAQRPGTPEDIARAALFFTSAESDFVSAGTLAVTGGHFR